MAPLQHRFSQPLRTAGVGRACIEDGFHQCIAARHHVADDEDIGLDGHLRRAEAFDQLDAQRLELIAHRRVDVGIAAGDAVAGFTRQRRQSAHESAADAEDVDVHAQRF